MYKSIAIGIGGGLALSGFWNLQDAYPIVANVVVLVLTVPFIFWVLRMK
jgi:hypothetical protein